VGLQAQVQVGRNERGPYPPAFPEDGDPSFVSFKPGERVPAKAVRGLDRAQARLLLKLEGEAVAPGQAAPGLGLGVQRPQAVEDGLADFGGEV